MKKYCVIIGDIKESRMIKGKERSQIQKRFRKAIETINKEFKEDIISKFLITLGDEFQGVLRDKSKSYDIILRIEELLYPVKFNFGVGVGDIATPILEEALGMDGLAFHNARSGLESAKVSKQTNIISKTGEEAVDCPLNMILFLLAGIKEGWTKRQREMVNAVRRFGNQQQVAKCLNIRSKSTVSEGLSSAQWPRVEAAEIFAKKWLSAQSNRVKVR